MAKRPTEADLIRMQGETSPARLQATPRFTGDDGFYPVDKAGNELTPNPVVRAAQIASQGGSNADSGRQTQTTSSSSSSSSARVSTRAVEPAPLPAATANEVAAMNQPRSQVVDPFSSQFVESLRGAIAKEGTAIQGAGEVLQRTSESNQQMGSQLEQDLRTLIGVKEAINSKVAEEFNVLRQGREESWQRQSAIIEQRKRVSQMNPLLQAIKGMFDPNFSRQALDTELGVEKALDAESVRVFQERTQSAGYLAELAAAHYQDKTRLAELVQRNNGLDLQAAMQWITLAGAETNNLLEMLDSDNKIERARQVRIENTLSNLSAGQVNEAMSAAAKSPTGTATVNGVPIPLGALQDQAAVIQKRGLTLKQLDLAIKVTDKELEDFAKSEILNSMKPEELRKLLENGGVYEGRQFDMVEIEKRLTAYNESAARVGEDASMETMEKTSAKFINSTISGGNRAVNARFEQLMGKAPGEYKEYLGRVSQTLRSYATAAEAAKQRGVDQQFYATNFQTLQSLAAERNKVIESAVTKWAGNNEDLKSLGMAWMTGQPIDAGVAARSLIHFARNGVPAGAGFTGDAAQMVRIAKEHINASGQGAQAPAANESIESILNRQSGGSQKEREQQLATDIASKVQGYARTTIADGANMLIPRIAAEKNLAFKALTREQWNSVVRAGDAQGLRNTAGRLNGMTVDAFSRMLREGPNGKIWQQVSSGLQGEQRNFSYWESILAANQMQAIYAVLDQKYSRPGFDAPAALREAVSQPEYLTELRKDVETMGFSSLGGFLFAALTGTGEVMSDAAAQQQLWTRSYERYIGAKRQAELRSIRNKASRPVDRVQAILAGTDASDETIQLITSAVQTRFDRDIAQAHFSDIGATKTKVNQRIDEFILTAKTGDPQLDAALKSVRPGYKKLAVPMTQSFQRFGGD